MLGAISVDCSSQRGILRDVPASLAVLRAVFSDLHLLLNEVSVLILSQCPISCCFISLFYTFIFTRNHCMVTRSYKV